MRGIPPHKTVFNPAQCTLNTNIFSNPLVILLNGARKGGHVVLLRTHDDWPITAMRLVAVQFALVHDIRLQEPFSVSRLAQLVWSSCYVLTLALAFLGRVLLGMGLHYDTKIKLSYVAFQICWGVFRLDHPSC